MNFTVQPFSVGFILAIIAIILIIVLLVTGQMPLLWLGLVLLLLAVSRLV